MKTLTAKDLQTVETWLPVFSGFYGTIWESDDDEVNELYNINELRKDKGLAPVEWDAVEWGYKDFHNSVAEGFTRRIGAALIGLGMVRACKFQELRSPREYNFANDSINVEMELTKKNVVKIGEYLKANRAAFEKYIKERYTSYDGFCSSHTNDVDGWTGDVLGDTLADRHKLGAVLNFILLNENPEIEREINEEMSGNGFTLLATNYNELTGDK